MSVAHYFQVAFVWWTSTYLWTYLAIGWWAGSVGSFANGLMSIFLHDSGFTNLLDITDPQSITPSWWYQRVFWGALWGLMFAIPIPKWRWLPFPVRGLLLSLIVSFTNFLYFLPMHDNGWFGSEKGAFFWVVVLLNNFAWGLVGVTFWEFVEVFTLNRLPAQKPLSFKYVEGEAGEFQ